MNVNDKNIKTIHVLLAILKDKNNIVHATLDRLRVDYNKAINAYLDIKNEFEDIPSDDSTNDDIIDKISSREEILYVIRDSRLGRGSAVIHGLKTLLKNKKIDFFVEIDTDLSEDPDQLPDMIKFFLVHCLNFFHVFCNKIKVLHNELF